MPLVAHTELPTFQRLRQEGQYIVSPEQAKCQDIRELHIGLLNMMPDSAIEATERQFLRLLGACNQIVQLHVHMFTIEGLERNEATKEHLQRYYEPFEKIQEDGLDGLIVSGANVTHATLPVEPFWQPLTEVFNWAKKNVTSTLCSCLATHALIEYCYGIQRTHSDDKRWGVFPHRVIENRHPLVADINTRFDVIHSRFNEIFRKDIEAAGLRVLVESEQAGVHLAVSQDLFRAVFFQGHPEYDAVSLLKEHKREVYRFYTGERGAYPPYPVGYFKDNAVKILQDYKQQVTLAKQIGRVIPDYPQEAVTKYLDNTWRDTAKAVFNNWLGGIYQLTHQDRRIPFMTHINPENPLNLRLD